LDQYKIPRDSRGAPRKILWQVLGLSKASEPIRGENESRRVAWTQTG